MLKCFYFQHYYNCLNKYNENVNYEILFLLIISSFIIFIHILDSKKIHIFTILINTLNKF